VPTSVDERENFVTPEVDCRACALDKSALAVNVMDSAPSIWGLSSKFGEDRLKIEDARDY